MACPHFAPLLKVGAARLPAKLCATSCCHGSLVWCPCGSAACITVANYIIADTVIISHLPWAKQASVYHLYNTAALNVADTGCKTQCTLQVVKESSLLPCLRCVMSGSHAVAASSTNLNSDEQVRLCTGCCLPCRWSLAFASIHSPCLPHGSLSTGLSVHLKNMMMILLQALARSARMFILATSATYSAFPKLTAAVTTAIERQRNSL